jgi:hypothetical protein
MKINELIKNVSRLVESREIIDHGTIRMLYSDRAVEEIADAEGCDEVDTGTIGDDDLAEKLSDLAEDGDLIAELYLEDLVALERAYRGEYVTNYLDNGREDELNNLGALIDAARALA